MHLLRHLTIAFLLLHLTRTANGQDNDGPVPTSSFRALGNFHYAEPSDSADFQQFIRSLRSVDGPPQAGATPKRYRQVWRVSEYGRFSVVSRGDGEAITMESERPMVDIFDTLFFNMLTSDGRACVAKLWEVPCAMICRTTTYYVEE